MKRIICLLLSLFITLPIVAGCRQGVDIREWNEQQFSPDENQGFRQPDELFAILDENDNNFVIQEVVNEIVEPEETESILVGDWTQERFIEMRFSFGGSMLRHPASDVTFHIDTETGHFHINSQPFNMWYRGDNYFYISQDINNIKIEIRRLPIIADDFIRYETNPIDMFSLGGIHFEGFNNDEDDEEPIEGIIREENRTIYTTNGQFIRDQIVRPWRDLFRHPVNRHNFSEVETIIIRSTNEAGVIDRLSMRMIFEVDGRFYNFDYQIRITGVGNEIEMPGINAFLLSERARRVVHDAVETFIRIPVLGSPLYCEDCVELLVECECIETEEE